MDMMIHLGGEHGLDEILDIAEHDSKSFSRSSRTCQRLDLNALHDGSQALVSRTVEDGFEAALVDA